MQIEQRDGGAASIGIAAPCMLDDETLDAVTGGMDCATGMKLASTFITLSKVASALGATSTAANLAGRAMGVMDGACS
jgi:hypothetical protein